MRCITNCEFMRFSNNMFTCSFFDDIKLEASKNYMTSGGKGVEHSVDEDKIIVHRCKECIDDGTIGSDTVKEDIKKIKKHLGWIADTFYSFKDTFEESLTDIYRIVKKMEGE